MEPFVVYLIGCGLLSIAVGAITDNFFGGLLLVVAMNLMLGSVCLEIGVF